MYLMLFSWVDSLWSTHIDVFLPCIRPIIAKSVWNIFPLLLSFFACNELFHIPSQRLCWYSGSFSSSCLSMKQMKLLWGRKKKKKLLVSLHGEGGHGGACKCNAATGEPELGSPQRWNRTWPWQGNLNSARLSQPPHSPVYVYSVHVMVHRNRNR